MFAGIYKHKWTSTFKDERVIALEKDCWREAIEDLTPEQVKKAVKICAKTLDWMPSCAEFRKLALGIPSLAEVRVTLATRKRENCKHPLELEIFDELGLWAPYWDNNRTEQQERKLIAEQYEVLTKKMLLGAEND